MDGGGKYAIMTTRGDHNGVTIRRKLLNLYLTQLRRIWRRFPASDRRSPVMQAFARHVDRIVRGCSVRKQYFATFFLRNRPELELLRHIVSREPIGSRIAITILACSKGAEVYSLGWAIRSVRPDLKLDIYAIDISQEIVDFASKGIYSLNKSDALDPKNENAASNRETVGWHTSKDQNAWMFERMSKDEIDSIFELNGDCAIVRPWLRKGITWLCSDAGDPALVAAIGPQDIVVANRFLCHMEPLEAQTCLRSIARLVKPGGYLFVSGIDLDVRSKVAREENWQPVSELARAIHNGDTSILAGWPLEYWGLEPFDERRPDWQIRYASVFQIGGKALESPVLTGAESARR